MTKPRDMITRRPAIKDATNYIIQKLRVEGFTIQRYNAYRTNSVYLKLDYGVANSIRLSDHPGKKHLAYRFNVITTRQGPTECDQNKFTRYYFNNSFEQLDELVALILQHRENRIEQFTREGYIHQMQQAFDAGRDARGFWAQAKTVVKNDVPMIVPKVYELNAGVIKW